MAAKFSLAHHIVRMLIPELSVNFTSASAALRFLSAEGMGIRKTSFLSYWREIVTGIDRGRRIKYVRKDRKPSKSLVGFSEHNIQNKFQVIGDIAFVESLTGRESTRQISFLTGSLKTVGEMEETLWNIADTDDLKYGDGAVYHIQITEIRSPDKKYA